MLSRCLADDNLGGSRSYLAADVEALDKAILAAVSKEPAKRDAGAEQWIRDRLAEIAKQRAALQAVFATEFPDYAALSNPQPLAEAATRLATSTFAIMKADAKLGRAAALRNAMLTYMNDRGSPLNAYPAFWGPFSIIGEGAAR